MIRRVPLAWSVGAIILIPAAIGVGWWFYWPTYHRNHLLAVAEKALEANDLPLAKASLEKLLKENADSPKVPATTSGAGQQVHAQLLYARVLRRLGRKDDAWGPLQAAVQGGLPEPEGRREYALLEAADDFPLAENALRRALEDYPEDIEILRTLAQGYAHHGRWLQAEDVYTRWLEIQSGQDEVLLGRGHTRFEAGRFDQAADDFRQVLAILPNHFQARLSLAQCLLSDFKIDDAEAELNRCHQLLPARSEPLVGLGACALERGDLDKAQARTKEALALDPASIPALTLLGTLCLRRQRYDLAIPVFEKVIHLNPRDKQAHLYLAQALTKNGELEKAKKHESLYKELEQAQSSGKRAGRSS
jgi:tetratricopeptide (TPR) repeat protein